MVTKVNPDLTRRLEVEVLPLLTPYGRSQWNDLRFAGWKMLVVGQGRGRCYYHQKVVTVPVWAFGETKSDGYRAWYLGHEIAHAIAGSRAKHGPEFMAQLKLVCPAAWTHYEYGYKPRNAMAAGIPQADGTIPQRAPRAARTSSHPQSVINAKNLHLRNCLGVWLEYRKDVRRWIVRDRTNGYVWVASEVFAAASVDQLERLVSKALVDARAKRIGDALSG
jgi:hypothetical protein